MTEIVAVSRSLLQTEPTGFDSSLTNFLPLPIPDFCPLASCKTSSHKVSMAKHLFPLKPRVDQGPKTFRMASLLTSGQRSDNGSKTRSPNES